MSRRAIGALVVVSTVVGWVGIAPVAADPPPDAAPAEVPDWWEDLLAAGADPADPGPPPSASEPAESAPPLEDTPLADDALGAVEVPVPAVAEVTLAERNGPPEGGELPVQVSAAGEAAVGDEVRVEVLDQAAADRIGVEGTLVLLTGPDGERLDDDDEQPITVDVDYSGFADRFGGGYGDRLQVVALPACAAADPVPEGCDTRGRVLAAQNVESQQRLVVDVDDLAGMQAPVVEATTETEPAPEVGPSADEPAAPAAEEPPAVEEPPAADAEQAPAADAEAPAGADEGASASVTEVPAGDADVEGAGVVLALLAGPEGEGGSYKATPFAVSNDWNVGLGSGEFSWNYDVPLPAAPAGATPEVNIAYSSGGVDGMVSSKNTQASPVGLGWGDFADSFIERRYNSCVNDGQTHGDLCWSGWNASISLNGQASELVPAPGQGSNPVQWRLKSDPRWRVERLLLPNPSSPTEQNGDADGEYWKVTTPDGTQYWFGLGFNPGGGWLTASTWTVPVFGDDAGEPCYTASTTDLNWCSQAWRWNLDRVVDPKGNSQTFKYQAEENHYRAYDGTAPYAFTPYIRSGHLTDIYYGKRSDAAENYAANVHFETGWRCSTLDAPSTPACEPPHIDPSQTFPDTPLDMVCGSDPCSLTTQRSPTFFTTQRYKAVEVCVKGGPGGLCDLIDTVTLTHTFTDDADPTTAEDKKLFLTGIQRTGNDPLEDGNPATNTSLTLPPITFGHVLLANRHAPGGDAPMRHWRINKVTDEFGREINVTYNQPHPCANPLPVSYSWDTNTKNCFPQMWGPEGTTPTLRAFNKWLVTQIEVKALNGNSPAGTAPPIVTEYFYGDKINTAAAAPTTWSTPRDQPEAAWHKDQDPSALPADLSWSEWRGYQDVLIKQAGSRTRYKLYRGMHADPIPTGTRTVNLASLDGTVASSPDSNWLAGRVFDEMTLRADGSPETGTLHGYTSMISANAPCTPSPACDATDLGDARFTAENDTIVRRRTPAAGTVFRRQQTQTTYNGLLFFPEDVKELGWTDDANDNRCTRTEYAYNVSATAYLVDYPKSVTRYGSNVCSGTEVTRSETDYDGAAFGVAPTIGNPTTTRVKLTTTPSVTWATTTTAYDVMGRAREVTDPNGHMTTTDYGGPWTDPGYPFEVTVTNHKGHQQYTRLKLVRQVPLRVKDPNQIDNPDDQVSTRYKYDPLGRVTEVRQPTEPDAGPATWKFSYDIDAERDEVPVIRTDQLQDNLGAAGAARYLTSWVLYDSMLRERQTHTLSPNGGGKVIVSDTTYDPRGMVEYTNVPEPVTATAGNALVATPANGWRNRSQTAYDHIGRTAWELFWADDSDGDALANNVQRSTTTAYTHETVESDPIVGGNTRTKTDGLGRSVEVAEHDGTAYRTTAYAYDKADRLTSVTDPAANTINYTYDLAGRRLTMDDPDAGDWSYAYDPAGNQTRVTDATSAQVHTVYDELNRPIERHQNTPTGPLLAEWDYDASGQLGLLDRTIRHSTAGQWIVDVTGYDARNRPTGRTWDVPASLTGFADYSVTYGYDQADHPTTIGYPAVGGLAAETVTTTYDQYGLPDTMAAGATTLVGTTTYDDRGRPSTFGYGPTATPHVGKHWEYDLNQQLRLTEATGSAGGLTQSRTIGYDQAGNVTERNTTLAGASFRECFGYDQRHRLTAAWTTAPANTCASGTGKGTGANPYTHTYTYTHDGNIDARTEGATTIDYTYPASGAGSTRPHAPTTVGTNTYAWNPNGNQDTRTVAGQPNTLTWDAEHRLAQVDDPDGDSSFTYDADGARLLRQTPAGTTLYIEGHEITAPAGGGALTAVRSYGFGGQPVATRTSTGLDYVVTDNQGSVEQTIPAGATTAEHTRTYFPYGKVRTGGQPDTDHTWIGQIEDDATALNYLNARYYDPATAVFISPDSLYNLGAIKSVNKFAYSWGNPITMLDPSGRYPDGLHPDRWKQPGAQNISAIAGPPGGSGADDSDTNSPGTDAALTMEYCEMMGDACVEGGDILGSSFGKAVKTAWLPATITKDMILGDFEDCFTKHSFWACFWALSELLPVGKWDNLADAGNAIHDAERAADAVEDGQQIYRVVDENELADLAASGQYGLGDMAHALEGKFYWPELSQAERFKEMMEKSDMGASGGPYCITSGCIPQEVLQQIDTVEMDGMPAYYIPEEHLPLITDVIIHGD